MKKITAFMSYIFLALSVGIFCIAWTYPGKSNGAPGPGFFPMILSVIVFVLAVLLLLTNRKEEDTPVQLFTKKSATVFLTLLITAAYIILLRIAGFPAATVAYLLGILLFFRVDNWTMLVCVPVLTTVILYGVFTKFLSVQFPAGILF